MLHFSKNKQAILRQSVILCFFSLCGLTPFLLLKIFGLEQAFEANTSEKANFGLRESFGFSPTLSSQLKILALDDSSVSFLQKGKLNRDDWIEIFERLDFLKPKAVFIDELFSFDIGGQLNGTSFAKRTKNLSFPIYAGAFATPRKIESRLGLFESKETGPQTFENSGLMASLRADRIQNRGVTYAYGPSLDLRPAFTGFGHLVLASHGRINLFYRTQESRILPHISLYAASHIEQTPKGELYLDSTPLKTGLKDDILVNFLPPRILKKQARRIVEYLNKPISLYGEDPNQNFIKPGDFVLILPGMFTGSTDFSDSPLGTIPGGYILASMFNSVLTHQWLRPIGDRFIYLLIFAFVAASLGLLLEPRKYLPALALFALTLPSIGLFVFIKYGYCLPWATWVMTGFSASLPAIFLSLIEKDRRSRLLQATLAGLLPKEQIVEISRKPESLSLAPVEHLVTLVFVDIEGYSRIAEIHSPAQCFEQLKEHIGQMTRLIHLHGGVVNKTIGDGLLAYFGYRHEMNAPSSDSHVDKALQCAVAIQRENVNSALENAAQGKPFFPLRIGINTSRVFLGNIGTQGRIDFAIVGQGVNFAQRLEAACESSRIMLGASSRDLLPQSWFGHEALKKRLIQVKHHVKPVESYEFNPFYDNSSLESEFKKIVNRSQGKKRLDERFYPIAKSIGIQTELGQGHLVDFSHSGFSFELESYLAKDLKVTLSVVDENGNPLPQLESSEIYQVEGSIKWGRPLGTSYIHGMAIHNLSREQRDLLVVILRDFNKDKLRISKKTSA